MTTKTYGVPTISKKHKVLILIALALTIFVPYADASLVAAAGSTILTDIGGMELYSMLFSGKTLTNVIFMLLVGKLSDKFGRRNVLILGIVIAMIGYFGSGMSASIIQLIAWRIFTGISAGLCGGLVYVITGDLFKGKEYGTAYIVQLIASNGAFIGGPILGGVLASYAPWKFCFWIMVPIYIVILFFIVKTCPDYRFDAEGTRLDKFGMTVFAIGMAVLIFALATVGSYFTWSSPIIIGCFVVAGILLVLFFVHEGRIDQRVAVFPISLMKNPAMSTSCVGQICMTLNSTCLMTYIPYYVQNVMGKSPTVSGSILSTIYVSIAVVGIFITRQLGKNEKFRFWCNFTVLGESLGLICMCVFLKPSIPVVMLVVLCMGYGCFASVESTAFIMAAQSSLSPAQMGAGTASVMFAQSIASLMGSTIGGSILNSSTDGAAGIHNVFVFAAIATIIGAIVVVLRMPGKEKIEQIKQKALAMEAEAAN